jgi:hypothetical protein
LPVKDRLLLNHMNIKIRYIPKAEDESFYKLMLEKFRVLSLTQYDRVIFMDADVMTRSSLDYLFELFVQGVLKRNVVFAGSTAPANGGIFMLEPYEGAFDRVQEIIRVKDERVMKLPEPHWDPVLGWGHAFEEDENFETLRGLGSRKWSFYGSFVDQGLLYHYVRFVERSVSIVIRSEIQNWDMDARGNVHLNETLGLDVFDMVPTTRGCWNDSTLLFRPCRRPYTDYIHFTGRRKPWLSNPPRDFKKAPETSSAHFWFYMLDILNDKMDIGIDFKSWKRRQFAFLGARPERDDAVVTMKKNLQERSGVTILQ